MTLKMSSFIDAIKAAILDDATLAHASTGVAWASGSADNIHIGIKGVIPPDARFPCFCISPTEEIPERTGSSHDVTFTPRADIYFYVYARTEEESLQGNASNKLGLTDVADAIFDLFEFNGLSLADDFDTHISSIRYDDFIAGADQDIKRITGLIVSLEGYYHD